MKIAHQMTQKDFISHKVWEYVLDKESENPEDRYVHPILKYPVRSLGNRVVGTMLKLANGHELFAVLSNIDLRNTLSTQHFLTITIYKSSGERFDLSRYHDVDYDNRGPASLAKFLGMDISEIFPMEYDIKGIAVGLRDCLHRTIPATPPSRLSKDEIIHLAVHGAL